MARLALVVAVVTAVALWLEFSGDATVVFSEECEPGYAYELVPEDRFQGDLYACVPE